MNDLAEWALTNLIAYGAPILFVVSYAGSLGIPFPISLLVVAAGAFTRQGILDWRLSFVACLLGSVLADNSEYYLGWRASQWLERRFGSGLVYQQALKAFNRQGGWAVLLTRFWLTTLAPAVNLVAGGRLPFRTFLAFDVAGEALWVALYGGLGYLAGGEWEVVSQFLSDFTGLSIGVVILGAAVYFILRQLKKKRA